MYPPFFYTFVCSISRESVCPTGAAYQFLCYHILRTATGSSAISIHLVS